MSVDCYLKKRFSAANYNCAHFVAEVWEDLTGQNVRETLAGFLCRPSTRYTSPSALSRVRLLDHPCEPCIVFFQGAHSDTHVGVWIRGKVLHLLKTSVQYVPLEVAAYGYNRIRFFNVV